jgi:hypothetical protein
MVKKRSLREDVTNAGSSDDWANHVVQPDTGNINDRFSLPQGP